ncbi:hypothetical protein [Bacillus manliponensis]|uniref:hypothetical protein n=1 Tax=Bacillus manliponensis TaxID=574376 RepID=UPI003516880D
MKEINVILSDGQALTYYVATVTVGDETYYFEINTAKNYLAVYLIDRCQRRLEISSVIEAVERLPEEEQMNYWKSIRSITDSDWLVSNGDFCERGMREEEQAAFLHLKETVLDDMTEELGINA